MTNHSRDLSNELNFQEREIDFIEQKWGQLNFDKITYSKVENSNEEMISISFLENSDISSKRLVILKETVEQSIFHIAYILSVNSNLNSLYNPSQVSDGTIDIFCLEKGFHISKKIVDHETLEVITNDYNNSYRLAPFGPCFKSCVASHMMEMDWVQAAACLLAPEACAATFLVACTGYCTIGPGGN